MGIIRTKKPVGAYIVAGVAAVGVLAYVKLSLDQQSKTLAEVDRPDRKATSRFRPPIPPEKGSWVPTIARVRLPSFQVADMTDNGAFLLVLNDRVSRTKPSDSTLTNLQTYQLVRGSEITQIDRNRGKSALVLSPTGELKDITAAPQSYWAIRYDQKGTTTTIDASGVRRTMRDGSKIDVDHNGVVLVNHGTRRVIFRHPWIALQNQSSLLILEHGDDESIWVYEEAGKLASKAPPKLTRIKGDQKTEYPMPFADAMIHSLAQTGENIIGTFSSVTQKEPYRAYRLVEGKWIELPIPDGYVFSLVRKITFDGLAFGVVRDLGSKVMPVVWNGNQCFPLDGTPNWPKADPGTQIVASARNGNVFVQPIYDRTPGSNEPPPNLSENSYVLNIRR